MIFEYVDSSCLTVTFNCLLAGIYIMNRTTGVDASQGWIAWLMSGPWWHLPLKILIPVFGLLTFDLLMYRMHFTVYKINAN